MITSRTPAAAFALLTALAPLTACEPPTGLDADTIFADALQAQMGVDIVFLAMRVSPDTHMDALFQGAVLLDDAGCLRLASPDGATVVWPHGWDFEDDEGSIRILDADAQLVGRSSEPFNLGGGEVETLPQAMGFTQQDRELAEEHCPGKYWIVAG